MEGIGIALDLKGDRMFMTDSGRLGVFRQARRVGEASRYSPPRETSPASPTLKYP